MAGRQQQQSQEVAVRKEDVAALGRTIATYRGTFGRLLPAHMDAETFVGIAAGAMYRNEKLAAAAMHHPDSLIVALRDCARLGHEPGTDQYALTVRGGKVLGIEQYQGVIERMYRAGAVLSVHAEVVCKGETFKRQDPSPPYHRVPNDDWLDRDTSVANLTGAYAFAILEGGACSRVVAMGRAEIMAHREVATTTNIWDGPFGKSMWLKTVAHELEKWVPTSAEYRREQARAAAAMADALGSATPPATVAASATVGPSATPRQPERPETPTDALSTSGALEGELVDKPSRGDDREGGWDDVQTVTPGGGQ